MLKWLPSLLANDGFLKLKSEGINEKVHMLTIEMSQPYSNSALRKVTLVLIHHGQVNIGKSSDKYLGLSDKP